MSLNHIDPFRSQSLTVSPSENSGDIGRSDKEIVNVSAQQIRRYHILCVDDEVVGMITRAEILREHGYSVAVYSSPLEVLRCDLSAFDFAILDFEMPSLNGRDLFLRMRALGARFPIVLLTGGLGSVSVEDRILFARCIDKGMPIRRLLDTIAEFLNPNLFPDYGSREQT